MNALSMVASFFKEGGPFMFIILGAGLLIVAIALERMAVIGRAATINSKKMANDLVRAVGKGDFAGARTISTKSNAPAAKVAQAMLNVNSIDESRLQAAGDDAAALALPSLTNRLQFLNTLANVATLLGLLGTIFGLTTAFSAVGAADPAQRSAFLAAGISQALNTTAFGLIIAVPALLIHGWLVGLVEGIAVKVDEMTIRLSQAIAHAGETSRVSGQVVPMQGNQGGARSAAPSHGTRSAQGGGGGLSWDNGTQ
jgi:biopolymer transport protein ExbB/TolQ